MYKMGWMAGQKSWSLPSLLLPLCFPGRFIPINNICSPGAHFDFMTFSTQGHICKKLHLNPLGAKGTLCKSQSMCVQEHSSLRPLLFLPSGRFVKKQLSGAAKNFGTSAEEFAVRRCIHSTARHAAASGPGVPPPANPGCTIQFLQLG